MEVNSNVLKAATVVNREYEGFWLSCESWFKPPNIRAEATKVNKPLVHIIVDIISLMLTFQFLYQAPIHPFQICSIPLAFKLLESNIQVIFLLQAHIFQFFLTKTFDQVDNFNHHLNSIYVVPTFSKGGFFLEPICHEWL